MKKKPIVVFLLTIITAFIYGFYWLFKTMKFINERNEKEIFNIKNIVTFIIVFMAVDIPLFNMVSEDRMWLFFIVFVLHVIWIVMVVKTFYKVSSNILKIENDLVIDKKIEPVLAVILMFVYLTGIPYMQTHINKIVDAESI